VNCDYLRAMYPSASRAARFLECGMSTGWFNPPTIASNAGNKDVGNAVPNVKRPTKPSYPRTAASRLPCQVLSLMPKVIKVVNRPPAEGGARRKWAAMMVLSPARAGRRAGIGGRKAVLGKERCQDWCG